MTTQYTTILKLALPVQGELSGTWGDVVNDNITQMVEQAIAGKATINSWTTNAHTLTTADGTTSESRCAILELTDTGTALTGAGTVTCPTNTKLYIVDNNTAEIITIKTAAGTGVAVPVGKTMLVYCDGTNVVEGVTHANSLSLGTSTSTVNAIDTATDLGAGSSSNSNLPTQLAVKTYVDGQIAATNELSEVLAAGNVTGANDIDVENAQKVQFRDADIYLNSSVDGQLDIVADGEVQIDTALVDINGNLDVSGTTNIGGSVSFTKNAIAGVAISTTSRSSNTVTVTTSAVHGLTSGDLVNINGVANRSFNGYFTVAVSSTTVFTYSQTGADESSTGGTSTEIVYNLNASGTALNQMNGPLNIDANSGIDGLEITQSGSGEALSITGGNALFGDNDKAIFGIGNDLQIYHDASDSIINDNGTGSLKLQQGGSTKLEVTATGIDVTGTVTADGLTVDGDALFTTNTATNPFVVSRIGNTTESLQITFDDANAILTSEQDEAGRYGGYVFNSKNDGTTVKRMEIAHTTGDISFYDTSANQALFWDASAASLGIGTSSPAQMLELSANNGLSGVANVLRFNDSDTGVAAAQPTGRIEFAENDGGSTTVSAYLEVETVGTSGGGEMTFGTGTAGVTATEAMRIDSSGSVGIGTSSPATDFHVTDGGTPPTISGTYLIAATSSSNAGIAINAGNTSASIIALGDSDSQDIGVIRYDHSDNSMRFNTNSSEAMRIDSSGNVGIGQDTPKTTLNLGANNSGQGAILTLENTDTSLTNNDVIGQIDFYANDGSTNGTGAKVNIKAIATSTAGTLTALTFGTSNSTSATAVEAMRIDASGNVGIGTTSPAQPLDVRASQNGLLRLYSTSAGGNAEIELLTLNSASTVGKISKIVATQVGAETNGSILSFQTSPTSSNTPAERMRIASNGVIGVNTQSAAQISAGFGQITLNGTSGGVLNFTDDDVEKVRLISEVDNFYVQAVGDTIFRNGGIDPSGSEAMRIDANGNVGIGSTNPASIGGGAKLTVDQAADGNIVFARGGSIRQIQLGTTSTTGYINADNTSGGLTFNVNASERMRIDSSGNVGIGTDSPATKLHVANASDSNAQIRINGSTSTVYSRLYSDNNGVLAISTDVGNQVAGSYMMFEVKGSEAMRIDASGNLLVGTTNANPTSSSVNDPGVELSDTGGVRSTVASNPAATFNRKTDDGTIAIFRKDGTTVGSIGSYVGTHLRVGSGEANLLFATPNILPATSTGLTSDGVIDLGSTARRFKDLHLSTNIHQGATTPSSSAAGVISEAVGRVTYSRGSGTGGFGHVTFINGNGTVGSITTASSATAYNTSSDQRLKESIVDAPSASDDIDAIQVRSFDWKADGSHQKYGMVAQELQTVAPEAVSAPEDPEEMMGVDYSKLVPMMLKEIQSLRARVAQLES